MLRQNPSNMNSKRSISLLTQSLLELMKSRSYKSITVSELSKHAGVVRNTFYAHFTTLEDVLVYHLFDLFAQKIQLGKTEHFHEEINLVKLYFELCWENQAFLSHLAQSDGLYLLNKMEGQFGLLEIEGLIYENCEIDGITQVYANTVYANVLSAIVKKWIDRGMKETPEELSAIFKELIK